VPQRRYPGLTALVLAALALIAGALFGLRHPQIASPLLLPLGIVAAGSVFWRAHAGASIFSCGVLFLLVGLLLGGSGAVVSERDCRSALPDGAALVARAVLASQPAESGAASLWLHEVGSLDEMVPCAGEVRLRLSGPTVREATGIPRAGSSVEVWGRWWATPAVGAWPRGGQRAGVFVADSLVRIGPPVGGRARLLAVRGSAQERLRRLFGPRAAVAESLILAQRDGLDPELRDRFVRAGLIHLLAISGLHVGLIAGTLLLLARVLRMAVRPASVLAGAATLAYVAFLGAPHAAARAGLQVVLVLVGRIAQRPANPYALLAAAAVVLVVLDPLALLDPGFQLSFGGTLGIVALRRRLIDAVPGHAGRTLRDALATNVSAAATTTPLAAFHFGRIAPVGLLANLVAVPLMAATVPALALALAASFVSWPLARFLSGAGSLLLLALEWVAGVAARVPGGNGYASRDGVLGWTAAVLAGWLAARHLRGRMAPRGRRLVAAGVLVALLIAWPAAPPLLDHGAIEIHAIDVGQGDAYAIRSPAGRWILIDAGPRSPTFDAGRARVVPYLLRHGVRRLEAVVLTHPDGDHIGGAGAVLEAFPVGAVVDPAFVAGKAMFVDLLQQARLRGVQWLAADAGREFRFDDVALEFLFPEAEMLDASQDANDLSVVFRLTYGRFAALFMGDAPAAVERRLVASHGNRLEAQILKVGHHGSLTSTTAELLAAAEPRLALISVGRRNRYGHPAPAVVQRLENAGVQVLRTDLHGGIRLRIEADGTFAVQTAR
jgi:competence protein ComEC